MIYLDFTDDQQIRRTVDALEAERDALAEELRIARDGLDTPLPDANLLEPEDYRFMLKSRQEALKARDAATAERDALAKELAELRTHVNYPFAPQLMAQRNQLRVALEKISSLASSSAPRSIDDYGDIARKALGDLIADSALDDEEEDK